MESKNQKLFDIHQGNNVISLDEYLNKTKYESNYLNTLRKEGYNCIGYLVLTFDDNADYNKYLEDINEGYCSEISCSMERYFKEAKTYIKCDGKYNYQTNGFDEELLKK